MDTMDLFTRLWMGGIIAFGVIFYFIALRYAQHCSQEEEE